MSEPRKIGLRAAIAAGLLVYLAAGLAQLGPGDGERDHIFPFISWNMFAYAPLRGPYYVLVTRNAGKSYDPPREIGEAVASDEQRRIDIVAMANTLAGSVADGDKPRVEAARREIEGRVLTAPWSYDVYEGKNRLATWSSR